MAKQSVPSQAVILKKRMRTVLREHGLEYSDEGPIAEMTTGARFLCLPIGPALDELAEQFTAKEPLAPTVTRTDVEGRSRTYRHTAKTIELEKDPDILEAWELSLEDHEAWDLRHSEARTRLLAIRGVRWLNPIEGDDWIEEDEFIGFAVPESDLGRLYHLFKTRGLANLKDAQKLTKGIYVASAQDVEALDDLAELFRRPLESEEGPDDQGDQSGVGEGPE